ncbi:MAG: heme-dependent oxidative N-demethylase family protein [Mycobacterium sp.]
MTYIPVKGQPFTVSMGLRTMDPDTWIEIDEHYETELAEKRHLLDHRKADVLAVLPEGLSGSREVLDELIAYLPMHFPQRFPTHIDIDKSLHPLEAASLLVQEDLAVMSPQDGQWVLTAAAICFPSRWDLASKIGANMHGIHQPVPHYEERIGHATDAMFNKLTPERPVWRINWTVWDNPDLFQPSASGRKARARHGLGVEEFGDTTYFRTERQTLRKLPESGAILFTIRTYCDSLSSLDRRYPDFREHLGRTLVTTSQEIRNYHGWEAFWGDLMAWSGQSL